MIENDMVRPLYVAAIVLLPLLSAVVLVPQRHWTAGWVAFRQYEGTFEGHPVVLTPPSLGGRSVPLEYGITMDSGVCEIARIGRSGQRTSHCTISRGYILSDALPDGERLWLDAGTGQGRYVVRAGLKYHLLSPFLWRVIAGGVLVGVVVGVAARRVAKRRRHWSAAARGLLPPRQWAIVGVLAGLTGVLLYPAIHESGHALVGRALGAEVRRIVFTPLGGEMPHVQFGELPERAAAWNGAGAIFLPILVAYMLLLVWLVLGRRVGRLGKALLLAPAVVLLFASFGVDDHLLSAATRLGAGSWAGIVSIKLIPVLLTLAAYALIAWRWHVREAMAVLREADARADA